MLFRNAPVSAIIEMLDIMESSQIETSRTVLQRVVRTILDDAIKSRSPLEAIKSSLEFWKTHSNVQNPVYVMYLLIQQCLEHGWLDECELVVNEIAERRFLSVPCNSIIAVMEMNEKRGRLENNVRMCEALLKILPRSGLKSLNRQFYERYMKALLDLGRFSDVHQQHARLMLDELFPRSTLLAATMHEAKARQDEASSFAKGIQASKLYSHRSGARF